MKLLIYTYLAVLPFAISEVKSQQYSNVTYDNGTTIEVQSGADICAGNINVNGTYTGSGTICSGALPVELVSFEYILSRNNVILKWVTAFEINNSGFDIERTAVNNGLPEKWLKAGFVQGNGTVSNIVNYLFNDPKVAAGEYKYRLKQIDYNGGYEYFELSAIVAVKPPSSFSMGQNFPNPFNPVTKIQFDIPGSSDVRIAVYDLLGREIKILVNKFMDAGSYETEFDAAMLASGIYFYVIKAGEFSAIKKMTLIK